MVRNKICLNKVDNESVFSNLSFYLDQYMLIALPFYLKGLTDTSKH